MCLDLCVCRSVCKQAGLEARTDHFNSKTEVFHGKTEEGVDEGL